MSVQCVCLLLARHVNEMLELEIIEERFTVSSSPCCVVAKKNDSPRFLYRLHAYASQVAWMARVGSHSTWTPIWTGGVKADINVR